MPASNRSWFVTLLAWSMLVIGVIGLPISIISAAMILVKSYGTETSDPLGFFIIVLGPSILLACGVGLLRRWRWAWLGTLGLLLLIITVHGWKLIEGPRETQTFTSQSGVKTTLTGSGLNHSSLPIIVLSTVVFAGLVSRRVRAEFQRPSPVACPVSQPIAPPSLPSASVGPQRTWRVGHQGRDMMYYEELIGGTWQRLDIDGEMLVGRAHHVIYFAPVERWMQYPEWARHRRSEIIARIQSEFRAPDYEYHNGASEPLIHTQGRPEVVTLKQYLALVAAIVIMMGIAAGMGWLVVRGFQEGETYMPSKRPSQRRMILREQEPAFYWTALGLYSVIGLGSAGLAMWGIYSGIQLKRKAK